MKRLIKKILREEFEYKQHLFDLLRTGDSDNIEMVKMISQGQDINILELLIDYFKENPKPPYFKLLNHFELPDGVIDDILSVIFGEPVTSSVGGFNMTFRIYSKKDYEILYFENLGGYWEKTEYDEYGDVIYYENSYGYWTKSEYDDRGNLIYEEDSDGFWEKRQFDENGNLLYEEDSNGVWKKYEYDQDGNRIYYENSGGYWEKYEYDQDGNRIYFENSNGYWYRKEYDENNNQIYYEDSYGYIEDKR